MKGERLSFLAWCAVCATVIFTFLPVLLLDPDGVLDDDRDPLRVLAYHWQVGFGKERPEAHEWRTFDAAARADMNGYVGTFWMQRSLPDMNLRSPYLAFLNMNRFEATLDGEPLYRFNMDRRYAYVNPTRWMHLVPIDPQAGGQTLQIRMEWNGSALFGHDIVLVGELDQILHTSIHRELGFLICSFLMIVSGLIGSVLYARRRERVFGWFSLFCLSAGAAVLFACLTLQWFIRDVQGVYYWKELLTPISVWAGVGFYASALGIERRRLVRCAHYAMASYMLAAVFAAVARPDFFTVTVANVNAMVALAGFAFIAYALLRYRKGAAPTKADAAAASEVAPDSVRRWLLRGYGIFTLCSGINTAAYLAPAPLTALLATNQYGYRVIEGLAPNGLLLFMIGMTMVMVSRVRVIHRGAERNAAELLVKNKELEQFHRNLEALVDTRTAELEQANRNLALTLREKAETLAEISVLEERNRIAYEMHDVVGHTLTAAIVQIEATKRLAERQGAVAAEKLDLLDGLVRKGLEDIRQAVRMMSADVESAPPSLETSLRELMQYTEDTMEISIEAEISLPPDLALGRLTEQVLYYALQEGLTNSIRHGKCTFARFTLRIEGDSLRFVLISDGEPFGSAAPGFGLSSMRERVELLGGEVTIRSSVDEDNRPRGCELCIALPLH